MMRRDLRVKPLSETKSVKPILKRGFEIFSCLGRV